MILHADPRSIIVVSDKNTMLWTLDKNVFFFFFLVAYFENFFNHSSAYYVNVVNAVGRWYFHKPKCLPRFFGNNIIINLFIIIAHAKCFNC